MRFLVLTASLALAVSPGVFAQEGPSYDDTLSFIQTKLNVQDTGRRQYIYMRSRCELVKETVFLDQPNKVYKTIIDVKKLDPSKVQDEGGWVSFGTRENIKSIQGTVTGKSDTSLYDRDVFNPVASPYKENGPRVVRAFKHLIILCGGKEELF